MKKILLAVCALLSVCLSEAQVYSNAGSPDKVWGRYCYRELNGNWYDAQTSEAAMTSMPTDNNMVLAYYYRIPAGHARADVVWENKYAKFPKVNVKVIYPQTGQVLGESSFGCEEIASKERTSDLFGVINFPADDFYRVELTSENWQELKSIKYFNYYRESTDPVLIPRNFGGTSAYLSGFSSTHPDAPSGNAYDWAYVECMVPTKKQYPGMYYMTFGTPTGYMGIQTNFHKGGDEYERNVLFSIWDAENMDENPDLAEYLQTKVLDGNLQAVHTHAGGEGSSASVMFQSDPKWWRPDHWVQFLVNTRPMTTPVTVKTKDNRDSTFDYGYTVTTAWYKMDTMPEWRYMASMRAAGICRNLGGWHNFIEPFTSAAGQFIHRVYHRHAAMRSAASGKWYNRNQLSLGHEGITDRAYHYDYGRGATQDYDNCFFLDMGGYVHKHDSSTVVPLAKDMTFVDTINIDALHKRVDQAIARDDYYNFASKVNACADVIAPTTWTVVSEETSSASNAVKVVDGNEATIWTTHESPAFLTLVAEEEQTVTSFEVYWTNQYASRCHFVNIETSADGENWTTAYENLEIRCLDRVEVSLPQPIKTKYMRMKFHYKYTPSTTLSINELTFRGAHDLDKLKALAEDNFEKADFINAYNTSDLGGVKEAYNAGETQPLADALYDLASNGKFNRTYKVADRLYFSADHMYYLKNAYGYGALSANTDGTSITATGATSDDALPQFKDNEVMNDLNNNWLILKDDRFQGYYLYNVGAKKFLNFDAEGKLSTEAQVLNIRQSGKAFYITPWGENNSIALYPSLENPAIVDSRAGNHSLFAIYDNMLMEKTIATCDSILTITETAGKLALYKDGINRMLEAPVGVVGGFTSEDAREALSRAYENADADPKAFINAVENADVIAFDPENCVYRIKLTADSLVSGPFMTADPAMRVNTEAENNDADQIWRFSKKNDGYTLSSQGVSLKPVLNEPNELVITTGMENASGTYTISESDWAKYFISGAEWSSSVINGTKSPMKTDDNTTPGSTWYIEPASTIAVSLNSVGATSIYYDFSVILPEGLSAYAAASVDENGVIKLVAMGDTIPAKTPVILIGETYGKYDLAVTTAVEPSENTNLLGGVYFRNTSFKKGTVMTLSSANGKPVMKVPAIAAVNANQVYLPLTDDMPALKTYTFDFDNVLDGVEDFTAEASGAKNAQTYDLNGIPATSLVKGHIYIRDHKKILNK